MFIVNGGLTLHREGGEVEPAGEVAPAVPAEGQLALIGFGADIVSPGPLTQVRAAGEPLMETAPPSKKLAVEVVEHPPLVEVQERRLAGRKRDRARRGQGRRPGGRRLRVGPGVRPAVRDLAPAGAPLRDQSGPAVNLDAGVPVSLSNSTRVTSLPGRSTGASAGCGLVAGVTASSVASAALCDRGAVRRGEPADAAGRLQPGRARRPGRRSRCPTPATGRRATTAGRLGQVRVTGVDAGDRSGR